jgi:hypothetical protein
MTTTTLLSDPALSAYVSTHRPTAAIDALCNATHVDIAQADQDAINAQITEQRLPHARNSPLGHVGEHCVASKVSEAVTTEQFLQTAALAVEKDP